MRVLAFDDVEAMYDMWWPRTGAWSMARLRGTRLYYRLPRHYFHENARYLRTDPLSEVELRVHRPDLTSAVARHLGACWYEPSWPGCVFGAVPVIAVNVICLAPFGPRDSDKPAILLTADNGEGFTEAELPTKAKTLQAPFLGDVRLTEGVGRCRSGIKKRVTRYCLWGAQRCPDRVVAFRQQPPTSSGSRTSANGRPPWPNAALSSRLLTVGAELETSQGADVGLHHVANPEGQRTCDLGSGWAGSPDGRHGFGNWLTSTSATTTVLIRDMAQPCPVRLIW
jgi:hypothetical protein